MATLNPYLNFPGNTEEAFNFYKSVFGGEFITLQLPEKIALLVNDNGFTCMALE